MTWIFQERPLGPYEVQRPKTYKDTEPPPQSDWTKFLAIPDDLAKLSGWKFSDDKNGGPVSFVYTLDVPGYDKSDIRVSLNSDRDCLVIRTEPTPERSCRNSHIVKAPAKTDSRYTKYNKIELSTLKAVCKNGQLKISGMFDSINSKEFSIPVTDE